MYFSTKGQQCVFSCCHSRILGIVLRFSRNAASLSAFLPVCSQVTVCGCVSKSLCVQACVDSVPVQSSTFVARFSIRLVRFSPKVTLPTTGLHITDTTHTQSHTHKQRILSASLMLFLTKTSVVACHGRCTSCSPPPTKISLVNSSRRDLKHNCNAHLS